jgi:hypothetical protein
MRTWCYLVAAILAAHAAAAFAGGYLRVTGPAPLCFQPLTTPLPSPTTAAPGRAPTDGVSTNDRQAALTGDDGAPPCSTNTHDGAAALETATVATSPLTGTNSATTVAVESGSSTATPSPDQPAEQPPLTSQVLAEIFRHTTETATNPSTTVVLPAGFMPPPPALSRSSSATYTDQ